MTFLTAGAIAVAAVLTIPPLVALYFLKLRRQEVPISSTFFWKRAVQDLQVNAPFQRLRRNLLLLLQLLVLLLVAVALGQPLLSREERSGRSLIVLIDRSASMNVPEPDGRTRLDRAKAEAVKLVQEVGRDFDDGYDRGMVIAFSGRAQMMAPFTTNPDLLERAIESITPSDGHSRLREAVTLATAHAQSELVGRDAPAGSPVSSAPQAEAVLLSDGRIEDADAVSLERMTMSYVDVGVSTDNVGIINMSASRYYERPEVLSVLATLQNFGDQPLEVDVELLIAGSHHDIKTVQLPPAIRPDPAAEDTASGPSSVAFDDVVFTTSGVVEVRLGRLDGLAADNRAFAVIAGPHPVDVLLVTPGNVNLKRALEALNLDLTVMDPLTYERAPEEDLILGDRSRFAVVVFDGCSSARLPAGHYLFFGSVPQLDGFAAGEAVELDAVMNWDDSHPVMRHINPSNIWVAAYRRMTLPPGAADIIVGEQATLLSAVDYRGSRYVVCSFSLLDERRERFNTNLVLSTQYILFIGNVIQYLSGNLDMNIKPHTRPGDALEIQAASGTTEVSVRRPDGTVAHIPVSDTRTAHFGNTDQVGLYEAWPTGDERSTYAINLFDANESRIQPNADFSVGGEVIQSQNSVRMANVPLWPWLLFLALALLLVEWAVYSRRVRI